MDRERGVYEKRSNPRTQLSIPWISSPQTSNSLCEEEHLVIDGLVLGIAPPHLRPSHLQILFGRWQVNDSFIHTVPVLLYPLSFRSWDKGRERVRRCHVMAVPLSMGQQWTAYPALDGRRLSGNYYLVF
jgi:hypothetical protein